MVYPKLKAVRLHFIYFILFYLFIYLFIYLFCLKVKLSISFSEKEEKYMSSAAWLLKCSRDENK